LTVRLDHITPSVFAFKASHEGAYLVVTLEYKY
jgi:hypothetical protein